MQIIYFGIIARFAFYVFIGIYPSKPAIEGAQYFRIVGVGIAQKRIEELQ